MIHMSERPVFTYQTRPTLDDDQAAVLGAYAELYGRTERGLFAAMQAGGKLNDLKRDFLPRFGVTARQFNAVRIGLEGKIDSIKQRRPDLIVEAQAKIKKATKVIAKLTSKKTGRADKLHQKNAAFACCKHGCRACKPISRRAKSACASVLRSCFTPSLSFTPTATRRTNNGNRTGSMSAPVSSLSWAARMN